MRKPHHLVFLAAATLLVVACNNDVQETSDGGSGGTAGSGGSYAGKPCSVLTGKATLTSYTGPGDTSAVYSFEFGSQDEAVTNNDWDMLFELDRFRVNTVTDDASFIVDVGDLPLAQVPSTVDPAGFPTGQQGTHDFVTAVASHTYVVRTIDSDTHLWSAFRVTAVEPGESASISWIRSPDPDALEVPLGCL